MDITSDLIRFGAGPVSDAALVMMRLSLFDWAACGMAGAQEPEFSALSRLHMATGGTAQAQVFAAGRLPAPSAALVNGMLSHALDFDDTHFGHIGHPSVAVLPAVLALAEARDIEWKQMLEAALIGVEASIHVGLWLGRGHYQVGFHQTATAGAFGATLAAARVLRLSSAQTRHAIGFCASMASGLKAQFGTGGKPVNAGLAARTGVEAALWAEAGLTAAPDGLSAFSDTFHGARENTRLGKPGQGAWQIESISHKFHACCHGLHAMLEALKQIDVSSPVKSVAVHAHPRWMTVCNQPEPNTGLAAKFSFRHTCAMALSGVDTGAIASFSDASAADPELVRFRKLVDVSADACLSEMQSRVTVAFEGAPEQSVFHDLAAPIPTDIRRQKLRTKAAGLLGTRRAERLWNTVSAHDLPALIAEMAQT